jgi:hypothetical protein
LFDSLLADTTQVAMSISADAGDALLYVAAVGSTISSTSPIGMTRITDKVHTGRELTSALEVSRVLVKLALAPAHQARAAPRRRRSSL